MLYNGVSLCFIFLQSNERFGLVRNVVVNGENFGKTLKC